mgnify:CR=1 FL=1
MSVRFGYRQTTTRPTRGVQIEAIWANGKKKVPETAVDEEELRTHVSEVMRQSVEEALCGLLTLCQTRRYE